MDTSLSPEQVQHLNAIKQRDAECGENVPSHWTAQLDRRFLLELLKQTTGW